MGENNHFPEKYLKKLDTFAPGYTETVDGANTDDIKKFILTSEKNLYDIEHEKENNANLLKLKEDLKTATAPYSEAKGTESAKIKYCLFTLSNRNVNL